MASGTTPRGSRSGFVPLLAGLTSALALTGAAVYTVGQANCGDPGRYIRHDNHIELVGGCVDGGELPTTGGAKSSTADGAQQLNNFRP
ncbi:hypothetical protein DI005_36055 [Prauserella sp. PE36]|uniref:Secreted protein n=1 Tax=Prauserella endophytica TaxID=1592324 RepID=A0ABY2RUT8_9PSEU|nr:MULTISPECIES: hypothetical protein [Prauserella]PXY26557.1 hypothetical protein BAY59_17965 [Prauserella coralliicola]RBM10604.1 hypothetical protein DI005_36055 [Prauserella sp. PE36]TKG61362.1 hypothetical protein FCN18_33940 [Prauserella endophytica]